MKDIEKLKDFLGDDPIEIEVPIPGIYFLFHGDELVYIGQSKNISSRIFIHIVTEKTGKFDRAFYIIEPNPDRRTSIENELIGTFTPPLNVQYHDNLKPRPNRRPIRLMRTETENQTRLN